MSRIDVVIFGATGFTGRHTSVEMARRAQRRSDLTWAVAGRSHSKLQELMQHVTDTLGEDQSHVKIIVADVCDYDSLKAMCQQAVVLVNCCGPYRLYGEPVVRAAIECKTHHVDVTGEPQFIETMQLKYDAAAREAGVFVISACGFDSIPNDLGVVYLQDNFPGTLNSVESYMTVGVPPQYRSEALKHGSCHYGTWESLVYGLSNWHELKPLRQQLYPESLPVFKPKLQPRHVIHKRGAAWCVPFPGADGSVVYRTQRRRAETGRGRPAHFRPYFCSGGWLRAVGAVLGAAALYGMTRYCRFSFLRQLLLKYPRIFSLGFITHEGPTKAVMENSYFSLLLFGEGWSQGADLSGPPDKTLVAEVRGCNPGYGATVVAVLLCATTILDERARMPARGGVLTTGAAFCDTTLIQKLHENGVHFEIIGPTAK